MKIEIVVDPSKPLPLSSRVAPAPAAASGAGAAQAPRFVTPLVLISLAGAHTLSRGGATRGRRVRGRGGARKPERTPKTAADLDAEMEVCVECLCSYSLVLQVS